MACASASRRRAAGISLVEILVALGLTSLLVSVALVLAQSQATVQREQLQSHRMEENLRGAMAVLTRSLRQAGGAAQSGVVRNLLSSSPATIPVLQVFNDNPDRVELLVPMDTTVATVVSPARSGDGALVVDPSSGAAFQPGDLALLSDFSSAVLLRVQGTGGQSLLGVAVTNLLVTPPLVLSSTYPTGSVVLRATSLGFGLRAGDATLLSGVSLLWQDEGGALGQTGARSGPVAEDILDLQIAVGIDGLTGQPADGVLQEVGAGPGDDEWVFNVAGEALPSSGTINALRVTLVARSSQPGDRVGTGRPTAEDHAAGAADGYRWRSLTETITIRNLNLR